MVFSGASLSHMGESLAALPPPARRPRLFIGTGSALHSDDVAEAKAVLRRTMTHYAFLPYYRNYWKETGYAEEMSAIETPSPRGAMRTSRAI